MAASDPWSGSIDNRSLAAFRVGLGSVVALEAVDRSLAADLLSDAGPVSLAAVDALGGHASATVFGLGSSPAAVAGWLAAQFVVGVLLAMGVGSARLLTGLALALVISCEQRNPFAAYAGDALLIVLLVWSLGVSLQDAFAVHVRRVAQSRVAVLALLGQPLLVYWAAVLTKLQSEAWRSGQALSYVFETPFELRPFAQSLGSHEGLLQVATWGALATQLIGPALLLWPRTRSIGVALLALFQVGIWTVMSISLFPVTSIVLVIPWIPRSVWHRLRVPDVGVSRSAPVAVEAGFAVLFGIGLVTAGLAVWGMKPAFPHVLRVAHTAQSWQMFERPRELPRGWLRLAFTDAAGDHIDMLSGDPLSQTPAPPLAGQLPFRERRLWTSLLESKAPPAAVVPWLCQRARGVAGGPVGDVAVWFADTGHPQDSSDGSGVVWVPVVGGACHPFEPGHPDGLP